LGPVGLTSLVPGQADFGERAILGKPGDNRRRGLRVCGCRPLGPGLRRIHGDRWQQVAGSLALDSASGIRAGHSAAVVAGWLSLPGEDAGVRLVSGPGPVHTTHQFGSGIAGRSGTGSVGSTRAILGGPGPRSGNRRGVLYLVRRTVPGPGVSIELGG